MAFKFLNGRDFTDMGNSLRFKISKNRQSLKLNDKYVQARFGNKLSFTANFYNKLTTATAGTFTTSVAGTVTSTFARHFVKLVDAIREE